LLEAVIAMFLLFISGISLLGLLQSSDQAYTQAAQAHVALRLANEGLELARMEPKAGKLDLKPVVLRVGASQLSFLPEVQMTTEGSVLLVRSKVSWSDGRRNHSLELKSYATP